MKNTNTHPTHAADAFNAFLRSDAFTCVGAKTAMAQNTIEVVDCGTLSMEEVHAAIQHYNTQILQPESRQLQSLALLFPHISVADEKAFETFLWETLQAIHQIDVAQGIDWASDCDAKADSPSFSMSLAGQGFYVVGMHPHASRPARQAPCVTLVLNSHTQFEALKERGTYYRLKDKIRSKEVATHGSINPMLEDFGEHSEAMQYSGRRVGGEWKCPFHKQTA